MQPSHPIRLLSGRFVGFVGLFCLTAVATAAQQADAARGTKPNVVFLLADDLGAVDLGCYGADLHETPNLDRLAAEGVRFTQAYAMSVCSPTRSSIMTGKHAARLHLTIWREGTFGKANGREKLRQPECAHDVALEETTIAEVLKQAGYLTFHVGKWHLGDADHYPEQQGFDVNIGGTHWGAPDTFFYPFSGTKRFKEPRYVPGLGLGKPGDYLTDRFTDEAIELIDQAKGKPFLLNLWFHNPHTPIEAKKQDVEHFQQKLKPGMKHQNATFAAMIRTLDQNVGRLMKHLQDRGIAENTLVIFTSDNGGYIGKDGGQTVTNNAPLRSGKGSLYEGGIRVPLLVRWPGVTPTGRECDAPVLCTDFFKTISAAVGSEAKAEAGLEDGLNLLPVLKDPRAKLERSTLYFHYPHYYATTTPVGAVRDGEWKLLEYFEDNRLELFNLKEDPSEGQDLSEGMPERAEELREKLADWRKEVGARMPTPNRDAK